MHAGNFATGFWPCESISIAVLSGPGTLHRLGEEKEAIGRENFEIYTLAPTSYMGQHCHLGMSGRALSSWGDLSTLLIWDLTYQEASVTLAIVMYPYWTKMKKTWSLFTICSFFGFYQSSVIQNIQLFFFWCVHINLSLQKKESEFNKEKEPFLANFRSAIFGKLPRIFLPFIYKII